MMERKWLVVTVAVGVIALLVGVFVGAVFGLASTLPQITELKDENDELRLQYEELKEHGFTYYTVGDAINISNLEIVEREYFWETVYDVKGTITNVGDKPIETVYVYLILRNPDGTSDFSPYRHDDIEDLYIGESAPFEFTGVDYDESQTVEIFLVY